MLAHTARPLTFGPLERIIVQGQEGDSLFVVVDGRGRGDAAPRRRPRGQPRAAPVADRAGRDVAADRRAAQRDRARGRGRARVRDRPPPVRADPGRAAGARRRARARDGGAPDAPRARCSSATTPSAPARASRAGSGGCWRAPELAEQLQRVRAGGVLAERAHVARDRLGQVLRQPDAVLGRHDDRGREAGERQVRGGEAVAAQVAAAVGEPLGDRVEGGEDERGVVGRR